jgi:hypothetical protein
MIVDAPWFVPKDHDTPTAFFITPIYLQSVQNTMSKWEETETDGEEESSVALMVNGDGDILQTEP